jgi:Na+-translocating ferredoxin:NAD+ oxidoreductase RnfD subunit
MDISWMFFVVYASLLGARVLWLDQPLAVWLHQLSTGALMLFTFFMISDPMTIPNHRRMRWLYAVIVASGAILWQFVLFKPNALVWSLFLATPLVPLLDRWMRAPKHRWQAEAATNEPAAKESPGQSEPVLTPAGSRPWKGWSIDVR